MILTDGPKLINIMLVELDVLRKGLDDLAGYKAEDLREQNELSAAAR